MSKIQIPYGMDASTGQPGIAVPGDSLQVSQLVSVGATPTITLGNNTIIGTGGTATISGNNLAGVITLTTGTGILGTGLVLTMTLANGFTFPSGCAVLFSAANAKFASVLTNLLAVTTASTIALSTNTLGLGASTVYSGYYHIVGW